MAPIERLFRALQDPATEQVRLVFQKPGNGPEDQSHVAAHRGQTRQADRRLSA